MNFVDVQPQSFLDYAWTSPSRFGGTAPRSTRTSRKQNRCCDQCRKGKRACDAAILEDALMSGDEKNKEILTTFHYSDVFGPLAACGNCENTKKTCTFEWLRSQRMFQASTPQSNPIPLTKKRRMKRDRWQDNNNNSIEPLITAPQHVTMSDLGVGVTLTPPNEHLGLPADFPCGTHFKDSSAPSFQQDVLWNEPLFQVGLPSNGSQEQRCTPDAHESNSVHGSSILTAFPADLLKIAERPGLVIGPESESESRADSGVIHMPHKRRRRGSSTASAVSHCSVALTYDLISSANTGFLGDSLLRIYCDSFETRLSCWLTEKTCPYSKNCDVSLPNDYGPDWSRIYHRVFKLDQSASVRGRSLSLSEDRAASRALNLAIISFASQWAAPDVERRAKYPFHVSNENGYNRRHRQTDSTEPLYNRSFQLAAWHQARNAVHRAAGIESFRVVLAHIVLSLTQNPGRVSEKGRHGAECAQIDPSRSGGEMEAGVGDCEDLFSRLGLTLHDDDSPLYLERGLRLIYSLRSNVMMVGAIDGRRRKRPRCWKHLQAPGLETADRATVDVLFWLGVMFDTLSSAMHKRPLVICLEDSDLPAIESIIHEGRPFSEPQPPSDSRAEGFREDLLCKGNPVRKHGIAVRWPCSEAEAVSLLCKAAPIKVLLFRKLTRIQTLLARHGRCEQIEAAVQSALGVHEYWQHTFAPFLGDCIDHHYELPEQVQSWHVCLAVHWHLATLLLADLIEALDDSEAGFEWRRRERESLQFIPRFRERNCRSLSELARCACSQEDSLLSRAKRKDSSISQGALLSEPWLDVFIRAFAIGGAILLELTMDSSGSDAARDGGFERVEDCVRALGILGQRSDKALSAAKMISRELDIVRAGV